MDYRGDTVHLGRLSLIRINEFQLQLFTQMERMMNMIRSKWLQLGGCALLVAIAATFLAFGGGSDAQVLHLGRVD